LASIPTGLVDLDALIGGLHRSHLVVVAGRPGMGKSTVMVSVGRQIAERRKYGVGIISLEMDEVSIGSRMATDRAYDPSCRIAYNSMINGSISPRHQQIITNATFDLRALPIEFDFASSMTVAEIAGSARRMAAKLAKKGVTLDVLMIDYLKFIKATARYAGQKHYEIGEITAGLKALARMLNCCVVLFHQLNREVEKTAERRPGMEHLRESGDVEQDADVVILLYREAYYIDRSGDRHRDDGDPKKVEAEAKMAQVRFDLDLIVAKQRMGPAKDVRVFCDIGSSVVRSPRPPPFDRREDR
jgi:replicative DNA helicase